MAQGAAGLAMQPNHPFAAPAAGSATTGSATTDRLLSSLSDRRSAAHDELASSSWRIVAAAIDMADRFRRGGALLAFGGGLAASDAEHVAVEFVHPVIVGKRALPAIALPGGVASDQPAESGGAGAAFDARLRLLASPADIAVGITSGTTSAPVLRALETAAQAGLLTVALVATGDDVLATSKAVRHALVAPADDPCLIKELHVTTYHLLWELVHVLLEHGSAVVTGADAPGGGG